MMRGFATFWGKHRIIASETSNIIFAKLMHHIAARRCIIFKMQGYALIYLRQWDIISSPINKNLAKEFICLSKAYEFLKECGSFFVLSINGDYPAGRPFGAIMKVGEDLYLATNDLNQAHKQMRENEHIQIVAKKPTSREWIRVTGLAAECDDKDLKQRMLEECPILQQRFGAVGMEHFIMFKVKVEQVEIK